ncbi:MAG: nuclear transport factor 2 family protein [Isosphaeraceae bacterium]
MINLSLRIGLVVAFGLCGVVGVLGPAVTSAEDPKPGDGIEAIRRVLMDQEAAWNRGDLDGFLGGYWHSPGLVFQSGGDRQDGWEATRARYVLRYKSEGRAMGQVAFSKVEIESLGPDSALVRGGWRLTLPDGSRPGGLFTLIFRKFPDGWKIVHDHTSSGEPRPKQP